MSLFLHALSIRVFFCNFNFVHALATACCLNVTLNMFLLNNNNADADDADDDDDDDDDVLLYFRERC